MLGEGQRSLALMTGSRRTHAERVCGLALTRGRCGISAPSRIASGTLVVSHSASGRQPGPVELAEHRGRPELVMVGVRGHVLDQFRAQQLEREASHLLAEMAAKGSGGHRGEHPFAHQRGEHAGVAPEGRTALGVGEQHPMALRRGAPSPAPPRRPRPAPSEARPAATVRRRGVAGAAPRHRGRRRSAARPPLRREPPARDPRPDSAG